MIKIERGGGVLNRKPKLLNKQMETFSPRVVATMVSLKSACLMLLHLASLRFKDVTEN